MSDVPIQPLPPVMTTDEVAKLLRCSPTSVERYVFSHQLVAVRIGRERRFRAEDVLEFIAAKPVTAGITRNHRKPAVSSVSQRR